MPISAFSLGSAVSHKYATPGLDIAGSLFRGQQAESNREARRAALELKRQNEIDKQNAAWDRVIGQLKVTTTDAAYQNIAHEDATNAILKAQKAHEDAGGRYSPGTQTILQDAKAKQQQHLANGILMQKFRNTPVDQRTPTYNKMLSDLTAGGGDIRAVEGLIDPHTGEGFKNNAPIYSGYKKVDHNKVFSDLSTKIQQDFQSANPLGNYQEYVKTGIPAKAATNLATNLIKEPDIYHTYYDENRDFVEKMVDKNPDLAYSKTGIPLRENREVFNALADRFVKQKLTDSGFLGKGQVRNIPQNNNSFSSGNGFVQVGKQIYNFDTTDINQAKEALKAAGYNPDFKYDQGQSHFPSISPPTVASGNIQGPHGSVYVDNIKLVYIPSKNTWYASGNDKDGFATAVEVDNSTVGPIAALYKQSIPTIKNIMQKRMNDAGIKAKVNLDDASGIVVPIRKTTSDKITVQDKAGKKFFLPKSQLNKALKQGYTQVL